MRILIVDDLSVNLKLLRATLEAEGISVVEADNGVEALELLEREQVDCIVSDILMPKMDGYRFCHEVRKSKKWANIPFIFYTATYTSPSDQKLALELGADAFLQKPAPTKEILDCIRTVVSKPRRKPKPGKPLVEEDVLREYSDRLVAKLERKNIELAQRTEELNAALGQLRRRVEHSPAVIYTLKIEGERVIPNVVGENILRLLGFTVEESSSFDWWATHLHPEDREQTLVTIGETIRLGDLKCEYRMRHKDGHYIWVADNRRLVRDAGGKPAEIVGVWIDITDRKHTEDELRESERRFNEMMSNVELISLMLDTEARITYCNDYLLRLTGWRREEVLGKNWFEIFIPPDTVGLKDFFSALLKNEPETWHHENDILTRSGERRLIRWNNTVLRSGSGEVIGTASIGEDITEQRKLEAQILRSQRMESIGTLAGGIAHDLNNVLGPIMMGIEILKRKVTDTQGRQMLETLEASALRGAGLVKQVLTFGRGVQGERVEIEVKHILAEMEKITKETFPKSIRLHTDVAKDLWLVSADATHLHQVLMNLCVNARDAMPNGGKLTITAENIVLDEQYARMHLGTKPGPHVMISVMDTGDGIPPKILEKIFEPFFTTKEIGKGTGLGLATVMSIVKSHGGFVNAYSEVGKGSVFKIYLPASRTSELPRPAEEEVAIPSGNNEMILVVDDEASIREITRETLQTFGYRVVEASDGAEAIALYAERKKEISAVITDMMMPFMDGRATIRALQKIDPGVRIIAVSGLADAQMLEEFSGSVVRKMLHKPYTAKTLLIALDQVLREDGTSTA